MAVQKSKKSRSKRGMRRSHDSISNNTSVSVDATTKEQHLRHNITSDGFYKGKKVINL